MKNWNIPTDNMPELKISKGILKVSTYKSTLKDTRMTKIYTRKIQFQDTNVNDNNFLHIILLSGGPGGDASNVALYISAIFNHFSSSPTAKRNVIVYIPTQRGIGHSSRLYGSGADFLDFSYDIRRHSTLNDHGTIQPEDITVTNSAQDIIQLIYSIKNEYENGAEIAVLGSSYGTELLSRIIKLKPDLIDIAIFDSFVSYKYEFIEDEDTNLYRFCNGDSNCRERLKGQDAALLRNVLPFISNPSFNECTKFLYKNFPHSWARNGSVISALFNDLLLKGKPAEFMIPFIYHTYVCPDLEHYKNMIREYFNTTPPTLLSPISSTGPSSQIPARNNDFVNYYLKIHDNLYDRNQFFESLSHQSSSLSLYNSLSPLYFGSLINYDLDHEPDRLLKAPLKTKHTKMFFMIGSRDYNCSEDASLREIQEIEASKEVFIYPEMGHCPLGRMSNGQVSNLYNYIFSSHHHDDGELKYYKKEVINTVAHWTFHGGNTKAELEALMRPLWPESKGPLLPLPLFPSYYPFKSQLFKELGELKFIDPTDSFSLSEYQREALKFISKNKNSLPNIPLEAVINECLEVLISANVSSPSSIVEKSVLEKIAHNTFQIDRALGQLAYSLRTKSNIPLLVLPPSIKLDSNNFLIKRDDNNITIQKSYLQDFDQWHRQTFEYRFAYIHHGYIHTIISDLYAKYKEILNGKDKSFDDFLFMESFIDGIRLYWEPRLKNITDKITFMASVINTLRPSTQQKSNVDATKRLEQFTKFLRNCCDSVRSMRTIDNDRVFDEHIKRSLSYLKLDVESTDCNVGVDIFDGIKNITFSGQSVKDILERITQFQEAINEYFRVFDKKYPQHRLIFNRTRAFLEEYQHDNDDNTTLVQQRIARIEKFLKSNVYYMMPFEMI